MLPKQLTEVSDLISDTWALLSMKLPQSYQLVSDSTNILPNSFCKTAFIRLKICTKEG